MEAPFSAEARSFFRCPSCRAELSDALQCVACPSRFGVRLGRFPDFLSNEERASLRDELDFWKNRPENTASGGYADESEESYQHWARQLEQAVNTNVILEIGCGSGALLKRISSRVRFGLEPSEELLKTSSGFLGVIGNATRLPFRDHAFDLSLFKHSLHHIPDQRLAVHEAFRVTRPGGIVAMIEPNASHPQRRLLSLKFHSLNSSGLLAKLYDPNESFLTATEATSLGQAAGGILERVEYSHSDYTHPSWRQRAQRLYATLLGGIVPERYLYPNYLILLRKP